MCVILVIRFTLVLPVRWNLFEVLSRTSFIITTHVAEAPKLTGFSLVLQWRCDRCIRQHKKYVLLSRRHLRALFSVSYWQLSFLIKTGEIYGFGISLDLIRLWILWIYFIECGYKGVVIFFFTSKGGGGSFIRPQFPTCLLTSPNII